MIRSRVTLASTDAAAMQAATRSPFQIASPGTPSPSTGNPSVRTYAGGRSSSATARRSASTLATCMPEPVALVGLDDDDRPGEGAAYDLGRSSARGPSRSAAWSRRGPGTMPALPGGQDRGAGDQRAGAGAAAGLVDAGDRLDADPAQRALVAVEPGVAPDGQTSGQLTHGRSGGVGHVREGVGSVHPAGVVGGPEQDEDLADDEVDRHELVTRDAVGLLVASTCGRSSRRSGPGCRPSRRCGRRAPGRPSSCSSHWLHRAVAGTPFVVLDVVVLVERLAVDRDPALLVAALDHVALDADHPLHEVAALGVEPDLGHQLGDRVASGRRSPGVRASRPGP